APPALAAAAEPAHAFRMRVSHIAVALLLVSCAAQAQPADPIGFDRDSLMRHRIGGEQEIEVPTGAGPSFSGIPVIVTIAPDGSVADARPDPRGLMGRDPTAAVAAARQWRFRPFSYRGQPVTAQGTVEIA